MALFKLALPATFRHEGGSRLVNHPKDPGGLTRWGISLRFLERNGIDIDGDGDVDEDDIVNCTDDDAALIYEKWFWNKCGSTRIIEQGPAAKVYDIAVNAGIKRSGILAQRAANRLGCVLKVDGDLGTKSVTAINSLDPAEFVAALCQVQADFYRSLVEEKPDLRVFLKGWLRRAAWNGLD